MRKDEEFESLFGRLTPHQRRDVVEMMKTLLAKETAAVDDENRAIHDLKVCQTNVAKRILGKLINPRTNKGLLYTWIDQQGRQFASDGCRAFRLNIPIPGLPVMPYWQCPDLNQYFRKLDENAVFQVPRPNLTDISRAIHENRERRRKGFERLGFRWLIPGRPAFDPDFLLDAATMFPEGYWYLEVGRDAIASLFVHSHAGDCIILPMKVRDDVLTS